MYISCVRWLDCILLIGIISTVRTVSCRLACAVSCPQVSKIPTAARTAALAKEVLCENGLLEVKWIYAVKRLEIDIMKTLHKSHLSKMFKQYLRDRKNRHENAPTVGTGDVKYR